MRKFFEYDMLLFGPALFITVAGLATLFSLNQELFYKQLAWVLVAFFAMTLASFFNLKALFSYRSAILGAYLVILLLLVFAYFFAPTISNIRSWIVIGGFQFQPSEFMKAALIILFSRFFAAKHIAIKRFSIIFSSFIYFLLPAVLILLQPDLGTVLILFGIWFGYLLVSEIPFKYIALLFCALAVVGALGWNFALRDDQRERVVGLFNPESDPLGVNYSVIQSKIAIGSAGFFGKGFHQGTQAQLGFLPNAHNDFIFAAFVEEWGLLGGAAVIGAFLTLIFRIAKLGMWSDNNFSKLLCLGTAIVFLLHFVINLGSVLGLLPVVGVSFPLLSYGGSNLLTTMVLLGTIHNIAKRRAGF